MEEHHSNRWDTAYEWRVVLLLGLGFGLVGLDRWVIAPLLPTMAKDMHLNYQQMGSAIGVLALAWGVCSVLMGRLSDSVGRRAVLLPALLGFSVLSGLSGAVVGITSLLAIRGLMGATEGAYLATSVAATIEASAERRRGLNVGLQQCASYLFGLGLGPIMATRLLGIVPSWRWVFLIVGIPGLILAWFMARVLRDPAHLTRSSARPKVRWLDLLRARNILLAMLCLVCTISCVFVLGAMVPSYLQAYLHLSSVQMGEVMSAMGLGGFLGDLVVPGASDFIGRRLAAALAFVGAGGFLYLFTTLGPNVIALFLSLFGTTVFAAGLLVVISGPLSTESVSPALVSSAAGLVSGIGEIFGGGVGPIVAGSVADRYGIQHVFTVSFIGLACGLLLSLMIVETAPRRVAARRTSATRVRPDAAQG